MRMARFYREEKPGDQSVQEDWPCALGKTRPSRVAEKRLSKAKREGHGFSHAAERGPEHGLQPLRFALLWEERAGLKSPPQRLEADRVVSADRHDWNVVPFPVPANLV
jgi:hypothetical protein